MRKTNIIIVSLAIIMFFHNAGVAAEETASIFRVTGCSEIAPAFAGNPVGFSMIRSGHDLIIAFYDPDRQLTLAKRIGDEGDWDFVKINEFVALDAHNFVTISADPEGYLHMAANMHGDPLNYWRSTKPYDIASFERLDKMVGINETRCTYPSFFTGPNREFLFKYRDGMSGNGRELINIYDLSTKKWRRFMDTALLDGNSPYGSMNAYQSGPAKGSDGYYHLAWVWRDMSGAELNHTLQYARSKDLLKWETGDGKEINSPITIDQAQTIDPVGNMGGMINGIQLGFDMSGRPLVTYWKFDPDGDTQLYVGRLEEGNWKIYQMTDWICRWDFSGYGSIVSEIGVRGISSFGEDTLIQRFRNRLVTGNFGEYVYILDDNSLQPVSIATPLYPEALNVARSQVPGMVVNFREDWSQFKKTGKLYILRWETLSPARDAVKDLDWVPKDQPLQLVELEFNKLPESSKLVKAKDRNSSYEAFFESFNFEYDEKLDRIRSYVESGNYCDALKELRKYYLSRSEPELVIDPRAHPPVSFPLGKDIDADIAMKHKFTFNEITRVLPYDINVWEPFKPELLERWYLTSSAVVSTRPVEFDELCKASSLSVWFNMLNELPHLAALGNGYFTTRYPRYARQWAHDLGDWLYDNPTPSEPARYGPWYMTVAALRLDTLILNFCQFLDSPDIDEVEFFRLLRAIQLHRSYLYLCIDSNMGTQDDRNICIKSVKTADRIFPELNK